MGHASDGSVLYWFRRDLRLEDNGALRHAAGLDLPLATVFIIEPRHRLARASFWWLCRSLERLGASLAELGHKLIVLEGDPLSLLPALAKEANAKRVAWNRTFEPADDESDVRLTSKLHDLGATTYRGEDGLLFAPERIRNKSGAPFRVFTPFWRTCRQSLPRSSRQPVPRLPPPATLNPSARIDPSLLARESWATGFADQWTPGEAGAQDRLGRFLDEKAIDYALKRDRPDCDGTSRLSAHLHWGEIAPARILYEIERRLAGERARQDGVEKFLAELGWREFAYHLLAQFPQMDSLEFKPQFRDHPWRRDDKVFAAWKEGRTGVPFIDAGLRELWATGWMHNRARMVAASFLVKQLRADWRLGLAWFQDTLVDADLANNAAGWQWVAGCGADAAPYFRIFNPILQGRKFDPDGAYVRRWLPELADLPDQIVHTPWLADGFAKPVVDLSEGRKQALAARAPRP